MRLLSNTLTGYVNGEIMKHTYDAYDAVIPIRHYSAKDIKEIRRRQGVSQGQHRVYNREQPRAETRLYAAWCAEETGRR